MKIIWSSSVASSGAKGHVRGCRKDTPRITAERAECRSHHPECIEAGFSTFSDGGSCLCLQPGLEEALPIPNPTASESEPGGIQERSHHGATYPSVLKLVSAVAACVSLQPARARRRAPYSQPPNLSPASGSKQQPARGFFLAAPTASSPGVGLPPSSRGSLGEPTCCWAQLEAARGDRGGKPSRA